MSQTSTQTSASCPYLGLSADRDSIFIKPAREHRCYVDARGHQVELEHQAAYCLSAGYSGCAHFRPLPPEQPARLKEPLFYPAAASLARRPGWLVSISWLQVVAWLLIGLVIAGTGYGYLTMRRSLAGPAEPATQTLPTVTATPTAAIFIAQATPGGRVDDAPVIISTPMPPQPTIDLPAGQFQLDLYPAANAVGWIVAGDPLNHFGDRNLHVGIFEERLYFGAMQFNLSALPVGSTIVEASLELTGLSAEHLGQAGVWRLQLLEPEIDASWTNATADQLAAAAVIETIPPELSPRDLGVRQRNVFTFSPAHLAELERRLESGLVSFRLEGPTQGRDNLFTWDTGYGGGFGNRPVLRLLYSLPPTPTPLVIAGITDTPTPGNAVTAAALAATATYVATATGTATPLPENVVTATPPVVVTNTPIPANAATVAWQAQVATAETFLHGTPTPLPTGYWTATPTPPLVIVTSTPTAENVLTVVPLAAAATQVAAVIGTYTPVPANWVTPIIYTPSPPPGNTATAVYQAALATAEVLAYGPPTATPPNMWTATPTPIFVLLNGELPTPRPTPTATATPSRLPVELVGKIAFVSNRGLAEDEEPLVYVINPDGSGLALLSDRWPYELAQARDAYSADLRFRAFTKDAIRYRNVTVGEETQGVRNDAPAVFWYDAFYNVEEQLTHFGQGIAYGGVWSPAAEQIAFVSNDSGDDEIWVANRDGSNLRQLTQSNVEYNATHIGKDDFIPEVNKHPSWSPDGSQIVFWSNRTGNRQIWVMNADGSNLYSLSRTGYDDWDPVWIKYTDPPPNPARGE